MCIRIKLIWKRNITTPIGPMLTLMTEEWLFLWRLPSWVGRLSRRRLPRDSLRAILNRCNRRIIRFRCNLQRRISGVREVAPAEWASSCVTGFNKIWILGHSANARGVPEVFKFGEEVSQLLRQGIRRMHGVPYRLRERAHRERVTKPLQMRK